MWGIWAMETVMSVRLCQEIILCLVRLPILFGLWNGLPCKKDVLSISALHLQDSIEL